MYCTGCGLVRGGLLSDSGWAVSDMAQSCTSTCQSSVHIASMAALDTHDEFLAVLTEVRQVNPASPVTCTYAGTLDSPTAPHLSNGVCQQLDSDR
jgi:hypothetical protein